MVYLTNYSGSYTQQAFVFIELGYWQCCFYWQVFVLFVFGLAFVEIVNLARRDGWEADLISRKCSLLVIGQCPFTKMSSFYKHLFCFSRYSSLKRHMRNKSRETKIFWCSFEMKQDIFWSPQWSPLKRSSAFQSVLIIISDTEARISAPQCGQ